MSEAVELSLVGVGGRMGGKKCAPEEVRRAEYELRPYLAVPDGALSRERGLGVGRAPSRARVGTLMGGPLAERAEETDRVPRRLERYDRGYIEHWPVAPILRDAQVNTIWEGPTTSSASTRIGP